MNKKEGIYMKNIKKIIFNRIMINIVITLVVGLLYFYFALPPINITSYAFWSFLVFLIAVYYFLSICKHSKNGNI